MKKCVGRILLFIFVILIGSLVSTNTVFAEDTEIHDLSITVELQEDGSGQISEEMTMTNVEGTTENFIEHQGVSESEISDFEVYANGQPLDYQEEWDSDRTREEKENEYGIIELTNGGSEFVWGIPADGINTYELNYTVDDMVMQLEDGQAMNWAFFRGTDSVPDSFTIEVEAPGELTAANTTIALLGLEDAEWELNNGVLEAWKDSPLSAGEDIIVLLQFEEDFFSGLSSLDQTLSEQQDVALEGTYNQASTNGNGQTGGGSGPFRFFPSIFGVLPFYFWCTPLLFWIIPICCYWVDHLFCIS